MASNGSVVAESKQEADKSCAGTSPAPKPEVARKPQPPGNKPCPPLPKKPPVAYKPQSLSPSHGSPTTRGTPVSESVSPGASTPSNSLSPPPRPSTQVQGAAAMPPSTAPKPVRTPPPPLPKAPPKGISAAAKRKEPPPRPSPLPPARKQPPPVPTKRPTSRKPAVSQDIDKESPQLTGLCPSQQLLRSYDQVVVRENTEEGTHVKQTEGPDLSSSESDTSTPRTKTYQQVVVEENTRKCAKVSVAPEKDSLPQPVQPKTCENVVLKENSQISPSSGLPQFCEENAQPESDIGVSKPEECDHKLEDSDVRSEIGDGVVHSCDTQVLSSSLHDRTQTPQSSSDENTAETAQPTDGQICPEHLCVKESDKKSNDTDNSSSQSLSLSDRQHSVNKPNEQEHASNNAEERSEIEVKAAPRRKPPKERPPRPSVFPPPVRPKPKNGSAC